DPSVILAGHLEDAELIGLYRNALLFVYPSLYEGFGLPPLEAMACGCPAVVSKTASLPEVCGDAAFYVDPYDTDDIARGMEALINDKALRQRLIQKGKEQARRYDWGLSARKMLDILDNIECRADI
ncbi:MAG TPA: glycosyltransferase family 1 protein, partial [candidate division Zixibacteria bacterium]|nr:glycosyltransferase family 1 protein [candidate division Zixibacteria bacterium]